VFNLPSDLLAIREVVKTDFVYDPLNPKVGVYYVLLWKNDILVFIKGLQRT
jgi:hypothetical protein